jgi:hypothetical protein
VTDDSQVNARSKNVIRTLGHIHLCGVLHVAWQTRDGVDGQHMISLLYKDCLALASAGKSDQTYSVKTIIGLSEVRVEEADNGRGKNQVPGYVSQKTQFPEAPRRLSVRILLLTMTLVLKLSDIG